MRGVVLNETNSLRWLNVGLVRNLGGVSGENQNSNKGRKGSE